MSRIRLCAVADVADERPYRVDVEGHEPIAVYRVDGRYYATSNTCTHMEASLADDGEIDGCSVICTLHFCRFDLKTGAAEGAVCTEALKTYRVVAHGDALYLCL